MVVEEEEKSVKNTPKTINEDDQSFDSDDVDTRPEGS
jgi:hypothetical protein